MDSSLATRIEAGELTLEEAEETQNAYESFLKELEGTWTPDAIKEYVLGQMRAKYTSGKKYLVQLELDNRDARVQGKSYKERQTYTSKIKGGDVFLKETAKKGDEYKRHVFSVRDIVTPFDMATIQTLGFEKYLDFTYVF